MESLLCRRNCGLSFGMLTSGGSVTQHSYIKLDMPSNLICYPVDVCHQQARKVCVHIKDTYLTSALLSTIAHWQMDPRVLPQVFTPCKMQPSCCCLATKLE